MANAKSSIILDEGLNAVHGGAVGSYFALKYWLPIYDPRIDNEIHTSTQVATQSAGTDVYPLSATLIATQQYADLEGEKLFNADSTYFQNHIGVSDAEDVYSLPNTLDYVISGSPNIDSVAYGYTGTITVTSASITSASQSKGVKVNLINNNYVIGQVLSGTDLVADGAGGFTGTNIGQIPQISEIQYALGGGVNTSAVGLLYPVSSFSSMVISGDNVDAGRYNIRLEAHGPFRFNKFVMFVAKMNADGTEDTTYLPVPFSVSVFEGTTEKVRTTSDGTGLQWEGIIQLAFQRDPTQSNLTTQIIDTWTDLDLSAFTIATNKKVHVFDSDSGAYTSPAKMNITDDTIEQLRLSYNTSAYGTLTTCADGSLTLSADVIKLKNVVRVTGTEGHQWWDNIDDGLYMHTWSSGQTVNLSAYYDFSIDCDNDLQLSKSGNNTNVLGYFSVAQTSTFTSAMTINDTLYLNGNEAQQWWTNSVDGLYMHTWSSGQTVNLSAYYDFAIDCNNDLQLSKSGNNTNVLGYFSVAQTSTFTSAMTINDTLYLNGNEAQQWWTNSVDGLYMHTWSSGQTVNLSAYYDFSIDCDNDLQLSKSGNNTNIMGSLNVAQVLTVTGNAFVNGGSIGNIDGGLPNLFYFASDVGADVRLSGSNIFINPENGGNVTIGDNTGLISLASPRVIMAQTNSSFSLKEVTTAPTVYSTTYGTMFTSASPVDSKTHLYFVNDDGEYYEVDMTAV